MAHLINKDAFIAEIEKRMKVYKESNHGFSARYDELKDILAFLNTFEEKRVDLEKVFNDEYSKFSNDTDAMDYAFPIDLADFKDFAKHFFELGMQVSNKAQKRE